MRISRLFVGVLLLVLPACSSRSVSDPVAAAPAADRIECALAGSTDFGRDCSLEEVSGANGAEVVIVHHRDGGFRRLRVTADARGMVTADGAERTRVSVLPGSRIEVFVGNDRYRIPVTDTSAATR